MKYHKEYYKKNKKMLNKKSKHYYLNHKEERIIYLEKNKERRMKTQKEYNLKNRVSINQKAEEYRNKPNIKRKRLLIRISNKKKQILLLEKELEVFKK